jgi:hypothetical protein
VKAKLEKAKKVKNDEFYTQLDDINKEIMSYYAYNKNVFRDKTILLPCDDPEWSNFTKFFADHFKFFGLKKLISTSFAANSKNNNSGCSTYQPSLFETDSPKYDSIKTRAKGKIFTLTEDKNGDGRIDTEDLEWDYLNGNGSFLSEEIASICKEVDIIITNPPFSLFRDFVKWVFENKKQFIILGPKTATLYSDIFPLIKDNRMWAGTTPWAGGMWFETKNPNDVDKVINGKNMKNVPSVWFTNIDHGKRHERLELDTMEFNLKHAKEFIGKSCYEKQDEYNAIDCPTCANIPSDYPGDMAVPMSFVDKFCPEQFDIIGEMNSTTVTNYNFGYPKVNGVKKFGRIIIRRKA